MSIETELVLVVCASIIALAAAFQAGRRMSLRVEVSPDPMREYAESMLQWMALQTSHLRRMADAMEERNKTLNATREALRKII